MNRSVSAYPDPGSEIPELPGSICTPEPGCSSMRPVLVALLVIVALVPGCMLPPYLTRELTPAYKPQNVFVLSSVLPANIRRVALMPMACDQTMAEMEQARDVMEPIVRTELVKTHRFEICPVAPETLQAQTGAAAWSCDDVLPRDLLAWLNQTYGCDAVLFCRLTVFRGYAPLAVGWRMRLVDVRTRATLWAGDEVFDASQPSVQAGARQYQTASDEWLMENSPDQFGKYAAAQLLGTLPGL